MKRKGVLAVIGSAGAIFWPGAFIFGFPGVMAPYWQQIFNVGKGAIGNTLFFVLAAVGIFMFLVGRWQEKFGIRKMITIGSIICGLNMFIIAYASNIYMLYLWAFLMGIASCFIYIPALTTVQRWFPKKRGLVSGIVNLMFGLSAAIMSPLFSYILDTMGYVAMNIIVAIIALIAGITVAQFTESPEKIIIPKEKALTDRDDKPKEVLARSLTVKESLKNKSFWFLWFTWAFMGASGIAMVTLSTTFGLSRGFTMKSAVIILTAFNITNGVSRIFTGYLSDIVGRKLTMSITFFGAGFAYFLLVHVTGLFISALLAAIIGFAFGTIFAVSAPLASDCFGLKHFGAIFGLIFTAYGFVSGPLGPSLSGYLLDATKGNFFIVFTYLATFCFISAVFIQFVHPPHIESR